MNKLLSADLEWDGTGCTDLRIGDTGWTLRAVKYAVDGQHDKTEVSTHFVHQDCESGRGWTFGGVCYNCTNSVPLPAIAFNKFFRLRL